MGPLKKAVLVAVTVVVLLALDYLFMNGLGDFQVNPYIVRVIMLIGISITAAVSLNLINGLAGQFSIGHAGFMAVGGYAAGYVTFYHGAAIAGLVGGAPGEPVADAVTFVVALVAGALAAAVAGLVVGVPSLRLKGDYLAIVTLGFGEIIRVLILNIDAVGGAKGFVGVRPLTTFFWIFAVAVLTIVVVRNIATSTFGRALAAIREDEIAAEAVGVNTTYYKVVAFVISSAFAGVAGGLFGHLFGNILIPSSFSFVKSIELIVMIVLGGIGSITGAVLGAAVLTALPELLRDFDQQYPGLRMVIYSLLLVLLMIFRPQGLLGRRELNLGWLLRRSKTQVPVALTDASDARPGAAPSRPVDRRSTLGGDRDE